MSFDLDKEKNHVQNTNELVHCKVDLMLLQILEHAAKNLQKSFKTIIDKSLNYVEVERIIDLKNFDESTKVMLENNDLIKLCVKLKSLFQIDSLNILNDILNGNVNLQQNQIEKLKIIEKQKIKNVKSETETKNIIQESNKVETQIVNKTKLCQLPIINDSLLRERVFTHKSVINNKIYLSKKELIDKHNERLEFLGDSFLNTIVTEILFKTFDKESEGTLTLIRSCLVDNNTLREFSIGYGFDKKLKININIDDSENKEFKFQSDVFEAYVGALVIDRNYDLTEIKSWLTELYQNKIAYHYSKLKKEINKDAKNILYSLIGTAKSHPSYNLIESGDGIKEFIVECKMEDDILGVGIDSNQKDAGLRAAMIALLNEKMLKKYFNKRKATPKSESLTSSKKLKN